jgi:hypothetical protein
MPDKPDPPKPPTPREQRLAQALRANLRRRKAPPPDTRNEDGAG